MFKCLYVMSMSSYSLCKGSFILGDCSTLRVGYECYWQLAVPSSTGFWDEKEATVCITCTSFSLAP